MSFFVSFFLLPAKASTIVSGTSSPGQTSLEVALATINYVVIAEHALWVAFGIFIKYLADVFQAASRRKHERAMKHIDLKAGLQKEIYLEAAGAISAAMELYFKAPNLHPLRITEELASLKLGAISNKINMIASDRTLRSLHEFNREMSIRIVEMLTGTFEVERLESEALRLDKEVETILASQNALAEQIRTLTEDARAPLLQQMNDIYRKFSLSFNQREALRRESFKLKRDMTWKTMDAVPALTRLQVNASLAIRHDMGMECDEAAFRARSEEAAATSVQSLKTFIEKLDSRLHG